MQAIASGAQAIMLGESEIVLAGGIESMSRMPYLIDAVDARWGHKMGNFTLVDAMYRDGFTCSLSNLLMGETAEILAKQYGITRDASDRFALESQRKAKAAIEARTFLARDRAGHRHREGQAGRRRSRRASAAGDDDREPGEAAAGVRRRRASPPAPRPESPMAAPRWCWRRPSARKRAV